MKICYLVESTTLGGGTRVIFDQARALRKMGHSVLIRARAGRHDWYPYDLKIEYTEDLAEPFDQGKRPDAAIATYWTTVSESTRIEAPVVCHLCQGYEGGFPELSDLRDEIEWSYSLPIPKLTIGNWLSDRLRSVFGDERFPIFNIGQLVDIDLFKPISGWKKGLKSFFSSKKEHRYIVLLVGDYSIELKGIKNGLIAVEIMRKKWGIPIHLVRVSLNPVSDDEKRITKVDESHVMIQPEKMAVIYQRADLIIAPSTKDEGFGLPFAEALASGVAAVATEIPSYLSFDQVKDYAVFVKGNRPEDLSRAASEVLTNTQLRLKLAKRGPRLIRDRFAPAIVGKNIQNALENIMATN